MRVSEALPGQTIEVKVCGTYGPARYTVTRYQDYNGRVRTEGIGGQLFYLFPDNECRVIPDECYEAYLAAAASGNDDRR